MSEAGSASEAASGDGWREAGCLCGAVRISARPRENRVHACHCSKCRRWSGGLLFAVDCDEVRIAPAAPVGVYRSSEWAERLFCTACGSSLIWRLQDGSHAMVAVEAFDDQGGFILASEIFVDEQPGYYSLAAGVPRLTGAEVLAMFQPTEDERDG